MDFSGGMGSDGLPEVSRSELGIGLLVCWHLSCFPLSRSGLESEDHIYIAKILQCER